MDTRQSELWSSLQAFEFDPPGTELTFVQRLARECGWSRAHAEDVLAEYRRFLLLAASAGHPVTPSEEVDQAWHLHLAYSRSYWQDLCGRVLGRALHHGPTRGGHAEGAKFRDWYEQTLASYARTFGRTAPEHIWPAPEQRFAEATRFRRIDTHASWILPRRTVTHAALALTTLLAASCALDATREEGRGLLLSLMGVGVTALIAVLGSWLRTLPRPRARRQGRRRPAQTDGHASTGCGLFPTGCASASSRDGASSSDSGCGSSGCGSSGCGSSGCGGGGCGGGGD